MTKTYAEWVEWFKTRRKNPYASPEIVDDWTEEREIQESKIDSQRQIIAAQEKWRMQLQAEIERLINKWQNDRQELTENLPGYEYKNRVDDPEWEIAKLIILGLQARIKELEKNTHLLDES